MQSEQTLIKKGRILALKCFVEAYLVSIGKENLDQIFTNREITDETILTGEENQVLHHLLLDEYKAKGLNLNEIIEASGEKSDGKKLSKYEIDELMRRADMFLLQTEAFKKYCDANKK